MNGVRQKAKLQQTLRLIRNIPLARFRYLNKRDHTNAVKAMLYAYREQLIEIVELLHKSHKYVHPSLLDAIKRIEETLGIPNWHWIGKTPSTASGEGQNTPPTSRPPSSRRRASSTTGVPSIPAILPEEEDLYRNLLSKVRGDMDTAERLIENERRRAPHANRMECIRRAIQRWLNDNQ